MAWMPFTMSLASGDGDHGRDEKDAADTWASMAQSSIFIVVAARRSVRWRGSGEAITKGAMPPDGMGRASCRKASITGLWAKVRTVCRRGKPAIVDMALQQLLFDRWRRQEGFPQDGDG
jgi:hypothetical protein